MHLRDAIPEVFRRALYLAAVAPLFLSVLAAAEKRAAVTVDQAGLLKAPDSLSQDASWTVARTAPKVQIYLFTGLPERGPRTLWSSWGDGCLTRDGSYYTSIGDHLGRDATSYVYRYDPAAGTAERVVDVAEAIGQKPGQYGHGKIHGGLHEAGDGSLYFATYWGAHREVDAAFGPDYQGSILLRYDPQNKQVENLGAIVPRQGLPASYFDPQRGLLYFFAQYEGNIAVYDLAERKLRFLGGSDRTEGHRTFLPDPKTGRVYFSAKDGTLHYYDPQNNQLHSTPARLPTGGKGGSERAWLRAAAHRPCGGKLYGMTAAGRMFAFDPASETIDDLGPNFGEGAYTAVMVASPDEKFLYYFPGAHGSSGQQGTPLVQYEIGTGRRKVLAFLNEPVRQQLDYNLGGTYNLQIDAGGERLFTTFNGAPLTASGKKVESFGQPSVLVIDIPASER